MRTVAIDRDRCDGCGLCVSACHEGVIELVDGKAVERTDEEIDADRAAMPGPAPTAEEQLRADVDYIAVMTGVSL